MTNAITEQHGDPEGHDRPAQKIDAEPFDISETYTAQSEAAGLSGWDDPEMDVYDDYDSHKPKL